MDINDSFVRDEQAGMEHAICTLMAALDGANLIHDVGYLGQGLVGDPAMLVMCDEIIAYVKRFMRGFDMSRELMAIDVIQKVGAAGSYLAEEHTRKYFKQELWQPSLINRDDLEVWKQKGRLTYGQRVVQKTINILENHRPEELRPDVNEKIEEIAKRAETELAAMHFVA